MESRKIERKSIEYLSKTTDLHLAAYLLTHGLELWAANSHHPDRVVFVLTPRPEPGDALAYLGGKPNLDVAEFRRAPRKLQQILWQVEDGRR